MANRPGRPCRQPGCGVITRDGWCEVHRQKRAKGENVKKRHKWYGLPIWYNDLRPAQLLKEPFCRKCAKHGVRTKATDVDHIVPHGGDWELFVDSDNL